MKKKYYVLYLGVIFLMLDIMIKVFPFPAFEEFFTLAPETVDMVINHVVGDRMRLDVASDFIGLILIFLGSSMFLKEWKENPVDDEYSKGKKQIHYRYFQRLKVYCILAAIFYFWEKLMPFVLNGNLRYRLGYGDYFVYLIFEAIVLVNTFLCSLGALDEMKIHTYNTVTIIFGLLSVMCYVVTKLCFFYDLTIPFWIYTFVSLGIMAFTFLRVELVFRHKV